MRHNPSAGLTLIELMTVICILSILCLSMPPISALITKQRLASSQNELRLLISNARAASLSYGKRITLCPLDQGGSCTSAWTGVLSVFTDGNGNRRQDPGETLLYVMQPNPSITVTWRGMKPANSLHFSAQGVTFVSNGTFSICSKNHDETFRLIVSRQGRTRTDRIKQLCKDDPTT